MSLKCLFCCGHTDTVVVKRCGAMHCKLVKNLVLRCIFFSLISCLYVFNFFFRVVRSMAAFAPLTSSTAPPLRWKSTRPWRKQQTLEMAWSKTFQARTAHGSQSSPFTAREPRTCFLVQSIRPGHGPLSVYTVCLQVSNENRVTAKAIVIW